MRATWLTDLHLNFLAEEALEAFLETVRRERPEVIFVTGDTGESSDVLGFLAQLSRIATTYFVLGNHDYYGSSIAEVRQRARDTQRWLPALGPTRLTPSTMLVGVDGWGDARCGNLASDVKLADWRWISDLDGLMFAEPEQRIETLRRLGETEAALLRDHLARVEHCDELLVMTHVPPFEDACWYGGRKSTPDYLPWFTCVAVGDVLLDHARRVPTTKITVLCGHTHGRTEYRAAENLMVRTGGWEPGQKEYGNPLVQDSWTL